MKKRFTSLICTITLGLLSMNLTAQIGQVCQDPIPVNIGEQCAPSMYTFGQGLTDIWLSFTATEPSATLVLEAGYPNSGHVHRITMYQYTSTCTYLGLVESWDAPSGDGLPEWSTSHEVTFNGITAGSQYLVKVERELPSTCTGKCIAAPQQVQMCLRSDPFFDSNFELICPPFMDDCELVGNGNLDSLYTNTGEIDSTDGSFYFDPNALANGLVCYWNNGWGSADIDATSIGGSMPQYQPYSMQMWSANVPSVNPLDQGNYKQLGEGIVQNLQNQTIQYNKTYLVQYKVRSYFTGVGNFAFPISNYLESYEFRVAQSGGSNPLPFANANYWEYPTFGFFDNQVIVSEGPISYGPAWQQKVACFTADDHYDQLVIFPYHTQQDTGAMLHVDDVSIQRFPHVGPNLVLCSTSDTLGLCPVQGATYEWTPTVGLSDPTVARPEVQPPLDETWYVCTATFIANGDTCVGIDSVLVQPYDSVAMVSPDYQNICAGGSATVIGSAQFGHSWTSVPFDSTLVGQENNGGITVSPDTTTTYFVEILGPDSCIVVDTAIVYVVPPFDIEVIGPSTMCCDTSVYSVDSGYISYLFETSPVMLFGSNGYNEIYPNWNTITADTAYVICAVTDSLGCTATDSLLVTRNCCDMEALLPAGTPYQSYGKCTGVTYASDLVAQGITSLSSPNPILIYGTLVIDVNYAILGCDDLRMGVDAKINIEPGIGLNFIDNDVTAGCDKMWDGIYVADSTSFINMRADTVYDAKNAVVINHGGKFAITDNQFFNNGICIKVTAYNGVLGNNNTNEIIGKNEFASTRGTLKEPYNIAPMDNCEAGIQVTDVGNFRLRNSNTYLRLDVGVEGIRTTALIRSQEFYDLYNPNPSVYGNNIGAAIYFRGYTGTFPPHVQLFTGGTNQGVVTPNIVNGCSWGIRAVNNVNLTARFNEIYDSRLVGIYAGFNRLGSHTIVGNKIEGGSGQVGINCYANRATTIDVRNNFINWDLPDGQDNFRGGVVVENAIPNSFPVDVKIRNNQVKNCVNAVTATNMPYVKMRQNQIRIQKSNAQLLAIGTEYTGVNIQMCNNAEVTRNRVIRTIENPDSVSAPYLKGLVIENSLGCFVQRNETHRIGEGIHVYGANNGTDYLCNKMRRNFHGFEFDNADVLATFSGAVNTDNKWYNDVGYYRLSGSVTNQTPRFWHYNPNGQNRQPFPNAPSLFQGIDFTPQTNATSGCQTVIGPQGPNDNLRESQFGPIVRDEKQFSSKEDETKFYDQFYAVSTFDADNLWLTLGTIDDADYQSFYNACLGQNLGSICQVNSSLSGADYATATTLNSALSCNSVQEHNYKEVNDIYLATWAQDNYELTQQQRADLELIACQDALDGGPAVYSARVMLGRNYHCANGAKSLELAKDPENEQATAKVSPNPTSGAVRIELSELSQLRTDVNVRDLTGRLVHSANMQPNTNTESLNLDLPSGTYLIHIQQGNEIVHVEKIVILR